MIAAIADMKIFDSFTPKLILKYEEKIKQSNICIFDGNIPEETMKQICDTCQKYEVPTFFEPTSISKGLKPIKAKVFHTITYISPNLDELLAMVEALCGTSFDRDVKKCISVVLEHGVKVVILKLGEKGVAVASKDIFHEFLPYPPKEIVNVTGAGDSLVAGFVYGLTIGATLEQCIKYGLGCAKLSLENQAAISPYLTPDLLEKICQ
eukprot:TRINITY_DN14121_c0_g1_i1.p1 TRINITY_DN14121_c0_g1~~TRINITY_DN14121_c0_g1_i1.p1  ORF type:complete len:240 (-),score=35.84 TRINITY_DN14121_c0_g1_i1:30-653(-)